MKFGEALEQLKLGKKLKRKNWNGKNQFIFLVKGKDIKNAYAVQFDEYEGITNFDSNQVMQLTCMNEKDNELTNVLAIKTTSNQIQLGWLASQTDMLSDDWEVVE